MIGPCSKPNESKELDLDLSKDNAKCTPLDSNVTSFYHFNGRIVSCPKSNILPKVKTNIKKCVANGTSGNCATNSPTTGTVVFCP